jgi:hypothetical protein
MITCLALALTTGAQNEKLVERVTKGEPSAILEAGKTGDKTIIPLLEKMARPHSVPQINPEEAKGMDAQQTEALKKAMWRPVYTEPAAENARMALARLGVKEYLDEILLELTNPTNSPVYKERDEYLVPPPSTTERLSIQTEAFRKLAYIKDRSSVKVVASFLYNKEVWGMQGGMLWDSPSQMAMTTLGQITETQPQIAYESSYGDKLHAWQQWWEQNKSKYP